MPRRGLLIAAVLMLSGCGIATGALAQALDNAPDKPGTAAPSPSTTEYQSKLAAYTQARQKFDGEAAAYWGAVAQKRRLRNAKRRERQEIVLDDYVLTQPPLYAGPPRPSPPPQEQGGCVWQGASAPSPLVLIYAHVSSGATD
jgi:hypothetical protein